MRDAESGGLTLRFAPEVRAGVLEGHAVIVAEPPVDLDPASGVVLRLRLFCARITSVRRRTASSEDRLEDVTPLVQTEQPRVVHFPLDIPPAAGALEYHLSWAIDPPDAGFGADGEERALFDVRLLAQHPDGEDQVLAAGHINAAWVAPHSVRSLGQLAHLGTSGCLPPSLADAIGDVIRTNEGSVPWCEHCAMCWELELLTHADRVRELAEHYNETAVSVLLAQWDPSTGPDYYDRSRYRPCRCQRLRLGARPEARDKWWAADLLTRERLDTQLRQHVTAARLRHLAHQRRTLGSH
ncbi:hypothetical protein AB0F96_39360 [Streptomyces sp. NPDC023998]|uniref:hypothetical protein n=1 Tax=Streptomyces sp. NPDC023998 TaxID=3154597 RepID=UPI0033E76549